MNLKLFFFIFFIGFSRLAISQDDCICPEIYDPVCAQDSSGNIFEMPNFCMAECFGMTLVDDSLCVHYNPWEECDCPEVYEPVCVQDSSGYYFEMPNLCLAECFGFAVVTDSLCEYYNPWEECDCPDEYEPVCVQDSLGYYFEMPNACWAECFGYEIVTDSLCEYYNPWEECDCPDEYEPVCVQDSLGYYFEMPNACWAECFGYEIVTDSLCEYYNPWEACDCEVEDETPFICASDSLGNFYYVPNECFATCLGLTVLTEGDCDILVIDPEVDPVLISCLDSLNYNDVTTFQQAILLIHNECGLELPLCILNAPLFDDDESFIHYILENCGNIFGIGEDYSGSNILNLFNVLSNRVTTNAEENTNKVLSGIQLLNNPAQNDLRFRIKSAKSEEVNLVLTNINGQVVKVESRQILEGEQVYNLDLSAIQPGLYILQCTGYHMNESLKVIKL